MAGNVKNLPGAGGIQPHQKKNPPASVMRRVPPVGIPIRKQQKKRDFSQTPGTSKGESCQASPKAKVFAKKSRAYKLNGYKGWLKSTRR